MNTYLEVQEIQFNPYGVQRVIGAGFRVTFLVELIYLVDPPQVPIFIPSLCESPTYTLSLPLREVSPPNTIPHVLSPTLADLWS